MRGWIAGILLFSMAGLAAAQNADLSKANTLYMEGKKLEALPLYEELAKENPGEWLYFERLADCLAAASGQTGDPAEAAAIRTRMRDAAKKAVELGDPHAYLQVMASIDPAKPLIPESTSPGHALLKEGEKAFGAGNYSLAMEKYSAAYDADPKLYDAALFAGDTAYLQKDLKNGAMWFGRAIAIDPDRETAYRYWGDAIMNLGGDPMTAKAKFIDAIVADPYNKMSWQGIEQWAKAQQAVIMAPKIQRPAGPQVDAKNPNTTNIVLDINTLDDKKNPGGFAWMMYSMVRATYHGDEFKKSFPDEKEYRHSLKEEDAALSVVASTVEEKKIKANKLDESLRNLVDLHKAGMLDCWILISAADEGIARDYSAYRNDHRQLLHDYLDRFVIHGGLGGR